MKNKAFKLFVSLTLLLLLPIAGIAQSNSEETVQLVASGSGPNEEIAVKNALRSAIEQTYGAFVSANTTLLNEDLIKDEIVTISSGNIQSYEVISKAKNSKGESMVTVRAIVSVGRLVSFAKSHGAATELAGAAFAMNIKMRKLNRENEYKALINLRDQMKELCRQVFDYKVSASSPKHSDKEYIITTKVTVSSNKNYSEARNLVLGTLEALCLSEKEIKEYKEDNYPYTHFDSYDLRNGHDVINSIISDIGFFFYAASKSFTNIENAGKQESYTPTFPSYRDKLFHWMIGHSCGEDVIKTIKGGGFSTTYEFDRKYTEEEISLLTGYEVAPAPREYEKIIENFYNIGIYRLAYFAAADGWESSAYITNETESDRKDFWIGGAGSVVYYENGSKIKKDCSLKFIFDVPNMRIIDQITNRQYRVLPAPTDLIVDEKGTRHLLFRARTEEGEKAEFIFSYSYTQRYARYHGERGRKINHSVTIRTKNNSQYRSYTFGDYVEARKFY